MGPRQREELIHRIQRRLALASRLSALLAVVTGLTVLCGWLFDIPILRSLFPGLPQMKANAAIAFTFAGVSLWCRNESRRSIAIVAASAATLVTAIGLATLLEYLLDTNIGIDQWAFTDNTGDGAYPGRIPLAGAINFVFLGAMLLSLDVLWGRHRLWIAQWFAVMLLTFSFVVVLGYSLDVVSFYRSQTGNPVVLHGAILFAVLALGAVSARSDRGVLSQLLGSDAGGLLIRRLLPAAIVIPPALAWLRLQGEQAGFYNSNVGIALYATANTLIFSALIWSTASSVRRADRERTIAEARVHRQLAKLKLLSSITRAIADKQDLSSLFQIVVRSLEDQLPVDFSCICLYQPADRTLSINRIGAHSTEIALALKASGTDIAVDSNGLSRCINGELVYEPDLSELTFAMPALLARHGIRSLVVAPLGADGSVFGLLFAGRRVRHGFASSECEFLLQLSDHAALAAHQAKLYGDLQTAYEELRRTQATSLQQERLRALGQMASGIAHDINNSLSPMSLYTESLLERESGLTAKGREQLSIVQRSIDDVAHTVTRMRDFYRQRESEFTLTTFDLNPLVAQVIELTRARWRDQPQERGIAIELRTELLAQPSSIHGVEPEVRDALTNLIFNAVDAMPKGGVLSVRTSLRAEGEQPMQVCLEVGDSGVGMSPEVVRQCLEPFFTTKGERGTGLGLAMVYGMTKRHRADLDIDSVEGTGTTVRLAFPVERPAEVPRVSVVETEAQTPLRILLVDDDPLLMESMRHMLAAEGHLVASADRGQVGIDAFHTAQKGNEPFAVVITDFGMPYIDGKKVAAAIRAADSQVAIIMLTGWGQRLMSDQDMPLGVDRVLAKPPKAHELRAAISDATRKRRSTSATA